MKLDIKGTNNNFLSTDLKTLYSLLGEKLLYKVVKPTLINLVINPDQISELMEEHKFKTYDSIDLSHQDKKFTIKHLHSDVEARWTIGGVGYFFIPTTFYLVRLKVEKGDLIIINKNVPHWYKYIPDNNNTHSVIRFFTDENGWVADW